MGKVKAGATTAGRRVGALLREALGNNRPKATETQSPQAAIKEKTAGSEKEMPGIGKQLPVSLKSRG